MADSRNRVALVTGGSRGIGYAIADELAQHSIDLVLVARDQQALEAAQSSLTKKHRDVAIAILPADLSQNQSYGRIVDFLEHSHGKLDILVNNAGDFKMIPQEGRASPDDVAQDTHLLYDINAFAPSTLVHVVRPLMLRSQRPQQLDVLSSAALEIFPGNNPYGPSKAAHERVSLSTVADSGGKIHTYRVYPSNVSTRLTSHFNVPKLTPELVANRVVKMMLGDEGTDLYMKMGAKGLSYASFRLPYEHYITQTASGVAVDGLRLVNDHRTRVAEVFASAVRAAD